MNHAYDIVIIGAGIVGLTVVDALLKKKPALKIAILEKEVAPALHASGRNSGVMHCGIYYAKDTLKAKVCAEGAAAMRAYAAKHQIAYRACGKAIVATNATEEQTLQTLLLNAREHGIRAELLTPQQLQQKEPYAYQGEAIYCPDTAVIDSKYVVACLMQELKEKGVAFHFNTQVKHLQAGRLETADGCIFTFGHGFNCAGAYADQLAHQMHVAEDYAIVPFKGIYWRLNAAAQAKVVANIYPVPDISMPFLGVHFTRIISDEVYVGPTAIPAFGAENYQPFENLSIREALPIVKRMSGLYLANKQSFRRMAHNEMKKYHKHFFYQSARKLMPSLRSDELEASPKIGIRPQLLNQRTNRLEMDYILKTEQGVTHVLNAISPAFTSSFSFALLICEHSNI